MGDKQPALLCPHGQAARDLRKSLGMNQIVFWSRVGITQSGGSRYESGRDMPVQVSWALQIAYGTQKQSNALVEWLRSTHYPTRIPASPSLETFPA